MCVLFYSIYAVERLLDRMLYLHGEGCIGKHKKDGLDCGGVAFIFGGVRCYSKIQSPFHNHSCSSLVELDPAYV